MLSPKSIGPQCQFLKDWSNIVKRRSRWDGYPSICFLAAEWPYVQKALCAFCPACPTTMNCNAANWNKRNLSPLKLFLVTHSILMPRKTANIAALFCFLFPCFQYACMEWSRGFSPYSRQRNWHCTSLQEAGGPGVQSSHRLKRTYRTWRYSFA